MQTSVSQATESGLSFCFSFLSERKKVGVGQSQEMNTLFRFWSFFL